MKRTTRSSLPSLGRLTPVLVTALLAASSFQVHLSSSPFVGVSAMMANPTPFEEVQPDGQVIQLQLHGDANDSWMSDTNGYTVLVDQENHAFVYAEEDDHGGLIASTERVINRLPFSDDDDDEDNEENDGNGNKRPFGDRITNLSNKHYHKTKHHNTNNKNYNLQKLAKKQKHLRPKNRDCTNLICNDIEQNYKDGENRRRELQRNLRGGGVLDKHGDKFKHKGTQVNNLISSSLHAFEVNNTSLPQLPHRDDDSDSDDEDAHRQLRARPYTLRNLVVLIRFADHVDRILPSRDDIDILMNHDGPHTLCPTGSVKDVLLENSYGALTLESTVTDWVTVDKTETYYAGDNRGTSRNIWEALMSALKILDDSNMVDFDYFDRDGNNEIDSITFIHSGYGGEWGGTDQYGTFYTNRIWSHKWSITNTDGGFVTKSGVVIHDYHISPGLWGIAGVAIGRVGVIAHEAMHFMGLLDLYDTDGSGGRGIGNWGLMSSSWGWDVSQLYPPHLSAWCKFAMGWVIPQEAVEGTNLIEASEVQNPTYPQMYYIQDGFPEGEFLLIENRQRIGYDRQLPQGGLLIWHIDHQDMSLNAFRKSLNDEGYPGQPGWPENDMHYGIALLQADGRYDLERGWNGGDRWDVFHGMGVDELVPCINPSSCQYPNTDSYKEGIIARSNNFITNISPSGKVMSFKYERKEATPEPTHAPTKRPTKAPTKAPTPQPTFAPSAAPSSLPTNCYCV